MPLNPPARWVVNGYGLAVPNIVPIIKRDQISAITEEKINGSNRVEKSDLRGKVIRAIGPADVEEGLSVGATFGACEADRVTNALSRLDPYKAGTVFAEDGHHAGSRPIVGYESLRDQEKKKGCCDLRCRCHDCVSGRLQVFCFPPRLSIKACPWFKL